jgi:hypothetical protein
VLAEHLDPVLRILLVDVTEPSLPGLCCAEDDNWCKVDQELNEPLSLSRRAMLGYLKAVRELKIARERCRRDTVEIKSAHLHALETGYEATAYGVFTCDHGPPSALELSGERATATANVSDTPPVRKRIEDRRDDRRRVRQRHAVVLQHLQRVVRQPVDAVTLAEGSGPRRHEIE